MTHDTVTGRGQVQAVQKLFGRRSQVFYFDATADRHFQ